MTVAVCLVLFLTVGIVVQAADVGFGVWFTEVFVILGSAWALVRATGRSPAHFTRMSEVHPPAMLFGFLLGVANYVAIVIPLQFLTTSLAPKSWIIDESKIFAQPTPLELFAVITGIGLAAPICEEFLFRGVLQRSLREEGHRTRAVLLAAAVFSAFHFDAVGFLPRFELGILFGILFIRFDSLWPGVCAHAANNLVPTLLYFLASDSADTTAMPQVRDVLQLAALGLAVLVFLIWLGGVVHAWGPRPAAASTAAPDRPPIALGRAILPWATVGVVVLAAFFGARTLHARAARHPPPPAPPHVFKM